MVEAPGGGSVSAADYSGDATGAGGASGGNGGSSNPGVIGASGPGAVFYLDPNGLIHPTAIISQAHSTIQAAYTSMAGIAASAVLGLGDPDVRSAWYAFHIAWMSEAVASGSALNELMSLVPQSVKAMQAADHSGAVSVIGPTQAPSSLNSVSDAGAEINKLTSQLDSLKGHAE